jgi:hypothetical protein
LVIKKKYIFVLFATIVLIRPLGRDRHKEAARLY